MIFLSSIVNSLNICLSFLSGLDTHLNIGLGNGVTLLGAGIFAKLFPQPEFSLWASISLKVNYRNFSKKI